MHAPHDEPIGLLKDAAAGSQVATSDIDLEIPSSPPWIKRTPLPGMPTVDKRCLAVHRGVSHDGRFVVEVNIIKNKKATETQELDRFGPSERRNTLLLWSVGLYWLSYDIVCVLMGPCQCLTTDSLPRRLTQETIDLSWFGPSVVDRVIALRPVSVSLCVRLIVKCCVVQLFSEPPIQGALPSFI